MIEIIKYSSDKKELWDEFVRNVDNFSFLFFRDYIEYHSDRFNDFSLMLYENRKLKALLPGNIVGDCFYSHQGLTYGSLIHLRDVHYDKIVLYYKSFFSYLVEKGIKSKILKLVPFFYFGSLTQAHDYFLQNQSYVNKTLDIGTFLNCKNHHFPKSTVERRKLKIDQFVVDEDISIGEFWDVLEFNLREQHNTEPIHTLLEMNYLNSRFPENIYVFGIRNEKSKKIDAATLLYDNGNVLKMQYIATSEEGRNNRAIHALYYLFISKYKSEKNYIDMGTCMTGDDINKGLLYVKERFGASVYCSSVYSI